MLPTGGARGVAGPRVPGSDCGLDPVSPVRCKGPDGGRTRTTTYRSPAGPEELAADLGLGVRMRMPLAARRTARSPSTICRPISATRRWWARRAASAGLKHHGQLRTGHQVRRRPCDLRRLGVAGLLRRYRRRARAGTDLGSRIFSKPPCGARPWPLPAGEMRFAIGADYRGNRFKFNPGSLNASNSVPRESGRAVRGELCGGQHLCA